MATLPDLRALLIRQQADSLQLDKDMNATPVGTEEFGKLMRARQELGLAIKDTKKAISMAQQGRQSTLL
jgi:hypothetical protein